MGQGWFAMNLAAFRPSDKAARRMEVDCAVRVGAEYSSFVAFFAQA
jgi:hypothetical protein